MSTTEAELLKAAYQTGKRDFSRSHLQNVCLQKAHLTNINLSHAYLNRAKLNKVHLEQAFLNRAVLYAAD